MDRKSIFWLLFLGFVFTIPLSQFLSVRILVLTLVFSFFVPGTNSLKQLSIRAWDIGIYLLVLLIGLIYTDDITTGLRVLETNFGLLALPILFTKLGTLDQKKFNSIVYSFGTGVLAACLVSLFSSLPNYLESGNLESFFSYRLTEAISSHPTYLAYYLIFCITIGIFLLYFERTSLPVAGLSSMLLFLFVMLMLTSGTTAFISILLTFSYFILNYLLEPRTKAKSIAVFLVVIMFVMFYAIFSWSPLGESLLKQGDYWERITLWKAAVGANDNFMGGVGTGDYKVVLNEYYIEHGLHDFASDSYNAHNQFIQVFFSNGIIGVVSILILLGRPMALAMQSKNTIAILCFFPFFIYGMNEVFLGRYQGVIFFAILHQLFLTQYLMRPSTPNYP